MSRKSILLAFVIASVPAVARDGSGPPLPPAWTLFAPASPVSSVGVPLGTELDGLVALLAGLALAIGLAWRRL